MNTLLRKQNRPGQSTGHIRLLLGILTLLAAVGLAACTTAVGADLPVEMIETRMDPTEIADPGLEFEIIREAEEPSIEAQPTALGDPGKDISESAFSADEIAGLVFMREEEKLARDVYLTMYETWSSPIFQNIAASEQTHTDAVKAVLNANGLADPVVEDTIGKFVNPELQALYDGLVEQGRISFEEALRVGAAIEEMDILDLKERLAQTNDAEIKRVYGNLLNGSENHLRAYVSQLERQTGETYVPEYLPLKDYEAIVLAATGPGDRGVQGGNGRNGGNG